MNAPRDPLAAVLLHKAAEDFALAELAMSRGALADMACYHAQQVIEKVAKAVLVIRGIAYRRNHDLAALASLLPDDLRQLREAVAAADWLTLFATGVRYGEGAIHATPVRARQAIEAAGEVVAALQVCLGVGLPVLAD